MGLRQLAWFALERLQGRLFSDTRSDFRIAWLRKQGARIGEGCSIYTDQVLSEPYLLEIGDRVGISVGTWLVTHDGSTARGSGKEIFGRISVGDDTFIGCNCMILPGTEIGRDCIVGAGSVVRGKVLDGSVVMGNPARFVMTTAMARRLPVRDREGLEVAGLSPEARRRTVLGHFGRFGEGRSR